MITSASDLRALHCTGKVAPLDGAEAATLLPLLDGWQVDGARIVRSFGFNNYYETMAFVNALAYIAHAEDHHPELVIGYKTCEVRYDTHSVKGLSLNDFICAAKIDALPLP
jgi:4a-hydroxytetrahydrobiopterin dehydratase